MIIGNLAVNNEEFSSMIAKIILVAVNKTT